MAIYNCIKTRVSWSSFMSCKNKHLWDIPEFLLLLFFIFFDGKVRRNCIMFLWPPWAFWLVLKPHLYSTYSVIKSPVGDKRAGSGEESLKIEKCHQPHRGDVNQGTLTGRPLNWLWRVLNNIKLYFTAQCQSTQKHNLTRLKTEETRKEKPQSWIFRPGNHSVFLSTDIKKKKEEKICATIQTEKVGNNAESQNEDMQLKYQKRSRYCQWRILDHNSPQIWRTTQKEAQLCESKLCSPTRL